MGITIQEDKVYQLYDYQEVYYDKGNVRLEYLSESNTQKLILDNFNADIKLFHIINMNDIVIKIDGENFSLKRMNQTV